ncbi:MAG: hypothetical protein RIR97_1703 [Pseudomonadota bacterium]
MTIKALLLGSAAALSVVTGAQAADAIVAAAPEPMDYVKVCDAFGKGYFYIPGTETCLKIGGIVRYDIGFKNGDDYFTKNRTRARLEVSSANDTEYGKAYSFLRIEANVNNNVSAALGSGFYAGIGGFEFGAFDNQWAKFFGYGVGGTDWGGDYAFRGDQYVSYTADLGSAKAYVSLENDGGINNFTPDVSAGILADFGDGASAGLGLSYDTSIESFALKGVVRGKVGAVDLGLMGLYTDDANNGYYDVKHKGWGVIAGFGAPVADKINVGMTGQYFENGGVKLGGNVTWNVASGFKTFIEVYHEVDAKVTSGFVRFERKF